MATPWRQGLEQLPSLVAPFELEPPATALLVVDMQYMFAHPDYGYGKLLCSRFPELASYYLGQIQQEVVPNLQRLLRFFREHHLRIIFITVGPALPDGSDMVPLPHNPGAHQRARKYGKWLAVVGSPAHRILEAVVPLPGELVVNKTSFGVFNSTGLDFTLRNLGIDYLVITGVATHACVETTARDAADRGYRSLVVEDAVASFTPQFQEASLLVFATTFGRVETTQAVCTELTAKLKQLEHLKL